MHTAIGRTAPCGRKQLEEIIESHFFLVCTFERVNVPFHSASVLIIMMVFIVCGEARHANKIMMPSKYSTRAMHHIHEVHRGGDISYMY